ncbi:MAG: DUF3301 domain-containing protein [Rhodocyclaceae bacterium]
MLFETVGLLLLAASLWLWLDSLKARDAGMGAARAACSAERFLLLDDTVAIESLWPARDDEGQLRLRRVYGFEYSDNGNNRRPGSVTLVGATVIAVSIGAGTMWDLKAD